MRLERRQGVPKKGEPGLFWLGQAGFWIETGAFTILIDPYLSDSLAKKYAGKKHAHERMMSAPVAVVDVPRPDVVLITHAHTDHMDPETLGPLFEKYPDVPFVVPAACETTARERIGAGAQLILVDADEVLNPLEGLTLTVLPAAHEDLRKDAQGRNEFLGYVVEWNGLRVYHSGDTIPFDGLAERVDALSPQIMLLPVNGRDAQRLSDGIPGNLTFEEAQDLAGKADIFVPHHFDMFTFNTADRQALENAAETASAPQIFVPRSGETLVILR